MPRTKPLIEETKVFVRYHLGKGCFAPHTGQDFAAWASFVHLVQCWTFGAGTAAIGAMRATLDCTQPLVGVLRTFVQVIPAVGDWSHVAQIWPLIADRVVLRGTTAPFDLRELAAWERCGVYDADHKEIDSTVHFHGWKP